MKTKLAWALIAILVAGIFSISVYLYTGNLQTRIKDSENQLAASQFHVQNLETEKVKLQNQTVELTETISRMQNQITELNMEISRLQEYNASRDGEVSDLQRVIADLENQLYEKGPRLITKLGATDVTINPGSSGRSNQTRLFIEGVVWNIGAQTANNCRLHVILFQDDIAVNNTYINLGTIKALDCTNVRTDIYYTGPRLTDWKILPEFS